MVRRFQLMEPERGLRPRLANAASRLRDGLLRDNKVIPPVLGALALIVFAWIIAGVLIDDPNGGGGGRQQVANQSNQPPQHDEAAQSPEGAQGTPETPAPSVQNRDVESYAAFEQKDPFRELFQPPNTADGATDPGDDGGKYDGITDDGTVDDTGDDAGDGTGDGSGGDDFIDQTFPDDGSGGRGNGSGDGGSGGGGNGLYDSGGELFDSGGNMAP